MHLPYSMYYKPMGDLPYISSEQGGGLIIRTYEFPIHVHVYKRPIPIQELRAEEWDGLIHVIRTMRYSPRRMHCTPCSNLKLPSLPFPPQHLSIAVQIYVL